MARRLPPLNALPSFEAAARLLSFSKAAEELHVTHGAVSRAVRHLENQLGVQLFVRATRSIAMTAVGSVFAAEVRGALDRLAAAAAAAGRVIRLLPSGLCQGCSSFAVPTAASTYVFRRRRSLRISSPMESTSPSATAVGSIPVFRPNS